MKSEGHFIGVKPSCLSCLTGAYFTGAKSRVTGRRKAAGRPRVDSRGLALRSVELFDGTEFGVVKGTKKDVKNKDLSVCHSQGCRKSQTWI